MMMMVIMMMLNLFKSSKCFEAGKGREGLFTNKDLNEQYDACHILFRYFHPVDFYGVWCGFDNSLTLKAKSHDGLDATKLNRSDGGANVEKQRDGWHSHSYSTENAKCKWSAARIALNSGETREAPSEESGWTVHYS